jgi:predicted TIM-barrel fold metal-dependent hydrolase
MAERPDLTGYRAIDTMVAIPDDPDSYYDRLLPLLQVGDPSLKAAEGEKREKPLAYLFRNAPKSIAGDLLGFTLHEMDRFGVERAMIQLDDDMPLAQKALTDHPDRFFADYVADPTRGMAEIRKIVRLHRDWGIKAVTGFAAGFRPGVPYGDARWYPVYAKCVELDIAFVPLVGIPGPRVPYAPQEVGQLDEICYFFPELTVVMRHGAEPWVDLAVKLMLKWPNLYYSTSAFAPKHYPREIIEYANTRGAEKVIYAGYSPFSVPIERGFAELAELPLREHVWPLFLRENAVRAVRLDP